MLAQGGAVGGLNRVTIQVNCLVLIRLTHKINVISIANWNNPSAWIELQQKIRTKYTTEDDKYMFDTLLETRDVQQALDELMRRKREHQRRGDIELF
jgi:hypothetical protein